MYEPEGFACQTKQVNGVEISYFTGGHGAPIVLLHGYPQNKAIWHKIASTLAKTYTVVAPDLRGYGDSSKPDASNEDHSIYCKRTSALDIVTLTEQLDLDPFHIVGHDRGARVAHRMALDHPKRVKSLTSLDVMPTQAAFDNMDSELAFAWFHWHLMRQPYPLPEQLIGNSAGAYFDFLMERWCATDGAISREAHDHYKRQFCDPETIHATCAEYRSVALDLEHDEVDRGHKLACSVLAIWGANTAKRPGWQTGKDLDILAAWRDRAEDVEGHALDCGHFIPEEKPKELQELLLNFFARVDA